ncbi:major facilitator superfamily domain-containing protein [Corynascus novoguineensis]|uniref:Major facilitator superfamily domain-containing protein n=1 Tax=Corynascus novoguineensis TaxID=1126955 RepID=A0AAN7HFA1_9PEZI|nr:major facilitator superfamily domain-containing protein [Corynascus novoguineensis]
MAVVDGASATPRRESVDNEKNLGTTDTPPGKQHGVPSSDGSAKVEAAAIEQDPEPQRTATGLKWFIIFTYLMSTVLLFALDNTIVATIQPSIVEDFNGQGSLAWIGVSFVLGQVVILPVGNAYGMFSMKILFIINLILFELGSAICGAASNMNAIIVGRVIAGIGGAGVYVGGLTYISVLTTPNERPLYLAISMSVWDFGNVLGPIVGGLFATSPATWRWGFYINLPITALFVPAFLFSLPNINAMPDMPFIEKICKQDWVGIVVFTAFLACFSMAGSCLMGHDVGFVCRLRPGHHPPSVRPAGSRPLPLHFMRTKDLILIPIQAFLVAGSMMMSIYYTPLIFQFTRGDNPLMAGVRILPLICMIVFGCLFNGVVMPEIGYYMPWYAVGNALLVIGSALMTTITPSISNSALYGYTVLLGLGIGAFQSAGVGVACALAPPSDISNVVSVMTVVQVLGIILTLSVSGSIFTNRAISRITSALPQITESEATALITGASGAFYDRLSEEGRAEVVSQIMSAISEAFYYLVTITTIGFIASLFLSVRISVHPSGSIRP